MARQDGETARRRCRRVGVCRPAHADGPDLSATQNEETPGAAGALFRPIESKSSYCFAGGAGGVGAGFIDGASAGAPAGGAGGNVRWPVVAGGRVVSLAVRSPSPPMPNAKIRISTTTEMPA